MNEPTEKGRETARAWLACELTRLMYDGNAQVESLATALASARAEGDEWRLAIEDGLVCAGDQFPQGGETPKAALARLIEWHVKVALDPKGSAEARKIRNGAMEEACRAICDLCRAGGPAPKLVTGFADGVDRWMHRGDVWSECHAGPIRDLMEE